MSRKRANYAQVVEVVPPGGEAIAIAGDMNAHSKLWNTRSARNRNNVFWERLIEAEDLFIWNTEEETRMGPGAALHSIIDLKSAFNNVSKAHLTGRLEALAVEPDLIRWTGSFMSDRQVKLVLDGKAGKANPVDTGIPQGSPVAPILFTTYLSGIFDKVEATVPGLRGPSFVDDISW